MEKKLYKSGSDKMICGVCGGVAEYLGIDATIIRLVWGILGCTGAGIFAYLVAAVIIPNKEY